MQNSLKKLLIVLKYFIDQKFSTVFKNNPERLHIRFHIAKYKLRQNNIQRRQISQMSKNKF